MAETTVDHGDVRDAGAVREWLDRFLEAWHSHDPDSLPSLCTDDVLWEDPFIHPSGVAHGKEEVRAWLASIFRAMPDVRFELEGEPLVSLDGTTIAAVWRGRGRMTGPLDPPGFAPTGHTAVLRGVDVHSFRDGKLAHVLTITDLNAAGQQLGAVPPPGSRREKAVVALQRLNARRMHRTSGASAPGTR
jgi:steroid delta-isomerase-like uncharacterized protein